MDRYCALVLVNIINSCKNEELLETKMNKNRKRELKKRIFCFWWARASILTMRVEFFLWQRAMRIFFVTDACLKRLLLLLSLFCYHVVQISHSTISVRKLNVLLVLSLVMVVYRLLTIFESVCDKRISVDIWFNG